MIYFVLSAGLKDYIAQLCFISAKISKLDNGIARVVLVLGTMTTFQIQTKPSTGGAPAYALTPDIAEIIDKLAKHGCSARLIADYLGINPSTFVDNKDFSNAYKKSYCQAGIRVAHRQYELLESKNEAVAGIQAIWLGKQHLGQSDKAEQSNTGEIVFRVLHEAPRLLEEPEEPGQVSEGQYRELPEPEPPDVSTA